MDGLHHLLRRLELVEMNTNKIFDKSVVDSADDLVRPDLPRHPCGIVVVGAIGRESVRCGSVVTIPFDIATA